MFWTLIFMKHENGNYDFGKIYHLRAFDDLGSAIMHAEKLMREKYQSYDPVFSWTVEDDGERYEETCPRNGRENEAIKIRIQRVNIRCHR